MNFFAANDVFKRSAWLDNSSVPSFNFETAEIFRNKIKEIVFEYVDELECSNMVRFSRFDNLSRDFKLFFRQFATNVGSVKIHVPFLWMLVRPR